MPDSERPLLKANIDRLKLLFRECSGDIKTLVELRDELLGRRTPAAKELLKLVEAELGALDGMQARLINRETPPVESPHGSDRDAETGKPRVLSSRENAARKRIAELKPFVESCCPKASRKFASRCLAEKSHRKGGLFRVR